MLFGKLDQSGAYPRGIVGAGEALEVIPDKRVHRSTQLKRSAPRLNRLAVAVLWMPDIIRRLRMLIELTDEAEAMLRQKGGTAAVDYIRPTS